MANNKEKLSDKELEKKVYQETLKKYQQATGGGNKNFQDYYSNQSATSTENPSNDESAKPSGLPPQMNFNPDDYKQEMMEETDPDLMVGFDMVKLPSEGLFYNNKISEVKVEYLTAKDEDLLTTPALLENGTVLDILLKRKIKTKGIDVENMLAGDKNAILLFLRASSYGHKYEVKVPHPKTRKPFKTEIDLRKLKYKEIKEKPDANGEFSVKLPMRNKMVKFRLLTDNETKRIIKNAETLQESYNSPFAEISTLRLKSAITKIGDRNDTDYIHRFVDAMPAGDSLAVRRKMKEVEPDIDMEYDFVTPDGMPFRAPVSMGVDFFFPKI